MSHPQLCQRPERPPRFRVQPDTYRRLGRTTPWREGRVKIHAACDVGAGITGVGVAYHLSQANQESLIRSPPKVVILEARDFCAYVPCTLTVLSGAGATGELIDGSRRHAWTSTSMQVAAGSEYSKNSLARILVDGDCNEFRLSDTNDRSHDEHHGRKVNRIRVDDTAKILRSLLRAEHWLWWGHRSTRHTAGRASPMQLQGQRR